MIWVSSLSMRCGQNCRGFKLAILDRFSGNRRKLENHQFWTDLDLQLAVFSPNRCCRIPADHFQVTRRAPTRNSPKVLKSNTAPAGNRPPLPNGPKHAPAIDFFDFLEIPLNDFDESIFSETRTNFRSTGLGLVSLYALWKKLLGHQTRDFGPIFDFPLFFNGFSTFLWFFTRFSRDSSSFTI